MFIPKVDKRLLVLKVFDGGSRQPPQILCMFPALSESAVTEGDQSAHSNKAGIAMLLVGLSLDKGAHPSICAVDEVYKVLVDAMQSRWEGLVFDSVQISARVGLLPSYGVPL